MEKRGSDVKSINDFAHRGLLLGKYAVRLWSP